MTGATLSAAGGNATLRPVPGTGYVFSGLDDIPLLVTEMIAFLDANL